MFEKSKSEITFKEFQSKMNMINNLENDWGHFYDPDFYDENSDINRDFNTLFKDTIFKKEIFKKEIYKQEKIKQINIDIENQDHKKKQIQETSKLINGLNKEDYVYEEDSKIINIIETIMNYTETSLVTFVMVYFIFKVI